MNRRSFTQSFGMTLAGLGILSACKTPQQASQPTNSFRIKPARLKPGDTVGLVSPGSFISDEGLETAVKNLESLGFRVELGKNIRAYRGYLAGTDEERLADLHAMFADRRIAAVWCVRGGYGCSRLLPKMDYDLIRQNPKILIGYSDITALLQAVWQKCGLVCFHGPVGASELTDYNQQQLIDVLMEGKSPLRIETLVHEDKRKEDPAYQTEILRPGRAKGILGGGNLSLLAAMAGTDFNLSASGRLLFIEDVGEKPYRIDRMLTQVRQACQLEQVKGIALGVFSGCEADPDDLSLNLIETLRDRLGDLKCPVYYGLPFGHIKDQCTLPVGIEAELDAGKGILTLLEAAVS